MKRKKNLDYPQYFIYYGKRRLLIKYNYPPIKRESAVEKVIKQAELKYQNQD